MNETIEKALAVIVAAGTVAAAIINAFGGRKN